MILVIDNYDSFVYNLVQYLGELVPDIKVFRNDKLELSTIEKLNPSAIIISPGPGHPREAGISEGLIKRYGDRYKILGVCLGHQCIGEVYGGKIIAAKTLMHGKTSMVIHDEKGLYKGVENPLRATRYHSLAVSAEGLPDCLRITARTEDGEIMGICHREYPVEGVQFHPESILTTLGKKILANFLER